MADWPLWLRWAAAILLGILGLMLMLGSYAWLMGGVLRDMERDHRREVERSLREQARLRRSIAESKERVRKRQKTP